MIATPPAAWARAGDDWPNREASRFVRAGGITWHVQAMGQGPVALLLHGTGAATHSWRGLAPILAEHFTLVMPDLPGHGFTEIAASHRLSLPGMARDVAALLAAMQIQPALAIGHSAGAPVLARMCLDGSISPRGLVSLNGAFMPLPGPGGQVFAPLARFLVGFPVLPALFSWRAGDGRMVRGLLEGTGSKIDAAGVDFYTRLVRNPAHTGAALRMMAGWQLEPLVRDLPKLATRLLLLAGERDRAIPPADSARVQALVPGAELQLQPGLGHLAHEEDPAGTAAPIVDFARRVGAA